MAQWRSPDRLEKSVTRTYPQGHQLLIDFAEELPDSDLAGSVTITVPLTVDIGSETLDLGRVGVVLDNPTLLQRIPQEDRVVHAFTTPTAACATGGFSQTAELDLTVGRWWSWCSAASKPGPGRPKALYGPGSGGVAGELPEHAVAAAALVGAVLAAVGV